MAALNFPSSPTDGQQYTAPDGSQFEWDATAGKWKKITIYDTLNVATLEAGHYVEIADSSTAPSPTTNRLYAQAGRLYWNAILLDSDAAGGGGAAETANSIISKLKTVDSDGSGLNADTLDGQQGTYYLAYGNFTGTPNVLDSSQVQGIVDSNALSANDVMSLVQTLDSNGSGLNADLLDGQQGTYYLAYGNFTGTPNVLDSGQVQSIVDSNETDYTLDFVTGNGNTTTNSITVEDATINGLITIADSTGAPTVTTNKLYAVGGRLYWNAFLLDSDAAGGGGAPETANSILSKLKTIDSDGSGLNADTLDGQQGSYYLAYANFTGTPNVLDSGQVEGIANANYIMSQIKTLDSDTSGLNADTLDAQQGSYYLAYANFTGTPTVFDSADVQAIIDSDYTTSNKNKFDISFQLDIGEDDTFTLSQYSSFPFDVEKAYFATDSGTITANITIDGTSITGLSALSLSSTADSATATALNSVAIGNKLALVTTSDAGASNAIVTLACTRT